MNRPNRISLRRAFLPHFIMVPVALASLVSLSGCAGMFRNARTPQEQFTRDSERCAVGSADSCIDAAIALSIGAGTERHFGLAFEHADRACTLGEPEGCRVAGDIASAGFADQPAEPFFARACQLDADECAPHWAVTNETASLRAACDAEDARACRALALCHSQSAALDAAMGCEAGSMRSCVLIGANTEQQACARGAADACVRALDDDLESLNTSRAEALCAEGSLDACTLLAGARILAGGDPELEREVLDSACQRSVLAACIWWGELALTGRLSGVDPSAAAAVLNHACEQGSGVACVRIGAITTASHEIRLGAFTRACTLGEPTGCYAAARMRIAADLSDGDIPTLLRLACDGGVPESCFELAAGIEQGVLDADDDPEALRARAESLEAE